MILDSGKRQYDVVRDMYHGTKNDVVVCRNLQAAGTSYKTVWLVRDRMLARKLIELYHIHSDDEQRIYEECFLYKEQMCFVFPYERERSLEKFYLPTLESKSCSRQQIWTQIVTVCMTCGLPDAILYLVIKQNQIQVGADGSIWFQYNIDLSELDETITTTQCVTECARLLKCLMKQDKGKKYAGELLERKIKRKSYTEFIKLYKDIRLITVQQEEKRTAGIVKSLFYEKKDQLYRILFKISFCLFIIVTVMFLFELVFGDFSFYTIFRYSLKQIGTESLLQ